MWIRSAFVAVSQRGGRQPPIWCTQFCVFCFSYLLTVLNVQQCCSVLWSEGHMFIFNDTVNTSFAHSHKCKARRSCQLAWRSCLQYFYNRILKYQMFSMKPNWKKYKQSKSFKWTLLHHTINSLHLWRMNLCMFRVSHKITVLFNMFTSMWCIYIILHT